MSKNLIYISLLVCSATAGFGNGTSPLELLSAVHDSQNSSRSSAYNNTSTMYYIYPWDESYYWRFPLDNSTCKDVGLQHYMFENSGKEATGFLSQHY
jgi:hypothetical protein